MDSITHLILMGIVMLGAEPKEVVQPARVTDNAIASYVAADMALLDDDAAQWQLYIAAPPQPRPAWTKAVDFVVNATVSKSRVLRPGTVLANGYLLRYDLRVLVPNSGQLTRALELLDDLAERDPFYHLSAATADEAIIEAAREVDSVVAAPHIELLWQQMSLEKSLLAANVYRADFFIDQVFQAADTPLGRGLYYDLLQLPKPREGESDQEAILKSLGINEDQVKQLSGDTRAATWNSLVTSRVRRGDAMIGTAGLWYWVTRDIQQSTVASDAHPFYSLVAFKLDASEAIAQLPNGMLVYFLFDAFGNLQQAVPSDIAHDSTIPSPYPQDLTPGISCVRCHSLSGHGGLKPFVNDAARLLSSGRIGLVDDEKLDQLEVLDRVESLYGGNRFAVILDRGRLDHEVAVASLVNDPGIDPTQSVVQLVAEEIAHIWAQYRYTPVDARSAYGQLSGQWLDEGAAEALEQAIGRAEDEDPALAWLTLGGTIRPADWERVYTTAALRYYTTLEGDE